MDANQYEIAQNALRVFFEDSRKDHLSDDDLRKILNETLTVTYYYAAGAHYLPPAAEAARDDAEMIIKHLDLLRPILEAYWSDK